MSSGVETGLTGVFDVDFCLLDLSGSALLEEEVEGFSGLLHLSTYSVAIFGDWRTDAALFIALDTGKNKQIQKSVQYCLLL